MKMEIRPASTSEINMAFSLLKEAALWLKSKNIDYWQEWINPSELYRNWIQEGFDSGQFYFVFRKSELAGMFRLQWEDQLFWGIRERDAGYIHSFTTVRTHYKEGLGREILNRIEDVCRRNGKAFLRLDCGIKVKRLCDYYGEYGFRPCGEVMVHGERLRLFEKRITV